GPKRRRAATGHDGLATMKRQARRQQSRKPPIQSKPPRMCHRAARASRLRQESRQADAQEWTGYGQWPLTWRAWLNGGDQPSVGPHRWASIHRPLASTTDVSTCLAGIDQYLRSRESLHVFGTTVNPFLR